MQHSFIGTQRYVSTCRKKNYYYYYYYYYYYHHVYIKKFLQSDWWRTCKFIPNMVQKTKLSAES